jgi:chaperonin GroEL
LPVLEACVQAGERSLFVIAQDVRDQAVGLLVVNRERGLFDATIAVRAPSFGSQRVGILDDLAALTGGRAICEDRHDRLDAIQLADLGRVRHAWATRSTFGLLGWQGSRDAIRRRVEVVRAERRGTDDAYARDKIAERVGKLTGTAAVIRVGAHTDAARAERKLRLEATVRTGRVALREGVVPGGGAALAACVSTVEALPAPGDECIGLRALTRALLEPTRAIAANAGFEAGPIVDGTRCAAGEAVFDVIEGAWVDPWSVGLLDPVAVVEAAVESATSAVGAALVAEVLVHRRDTSVAVEP